ncbi:single-stranded DNA-binding protein [Lysinibacillus sp. NPDC096418]|uniref:single-stranded DNA-binding protein n=1 Tax=Lysinibacillus sp. NPDC096418 TaxID=3364138 RepID=UPI0038005165
MINRVVLVGRLTKDPDLKYSANGIATCRFTLAVNRSFKSQGGEQEADFIQCVAWRKQAENLANFQRKGNLIGVEGRIQTGSYEGQDGKRVYTTDVVADSIQFLESNRGAGDAQNGSDNHSNTNRGGTSQSPTGSFNSPQNTQPNYTRVDEDPFSNSKGPIEVSEDDLPF